MGFFLVNSRRQNSTELKEIEEISESIFNLDGKRETSVLSEDSYRIVQAKGFTEDYINADKSAARVYSGYTFQGSHKSLQERLEENFEKYSDHQVKRDPHNFMRIEITPEVVTAEVDVLGGTALFYRIIKDEVFLCTEFEPLSKLQTKGLSLNQIAIDHFISFGMTFGNETFFNEIEMVPLGHNLTFSWNSDGHINVDKRKVDYSRPKIDNQSIESVAVQFKNILETAVNSMVKDFKIDSLSLSGGADSRLTMALIEDSLRKDICFRTAEFDPPSKRSFYDLNVAKQLAAEFSLNHENYKDEFHGGSFDSFMARYPLRSRPKLGGVYGGEFFGGESLGVLPFKRTEFSRDIVNQIFDNTNRSTETEFSIDDFENWQKNLIGPSKDFFGSVLVFRNSFMSTIYEGDLHWNSPCMIPQKVFSVFNLGEVIWELIHLPYDYLLDYRLYIELYKVLDSRYTDIPFDAAMVRKPSKPFKDAEDVFSLSEVELRSPESTHPISLDDLFDDQNFLSSLAKSKIVKLENVNKFRDDFDVEYHRRIAVLSLWEKKFL